MNLRKSLTIASILLVASGLALMAPLGVSWIQQAEALSHMPTYVVQTPIPMATASQVVVQGTPIHITVPSVGVDATIEPGVYNPSTGQWTLTENTAFFATATNLANNIGGDTFIYGHDSTKIFGNLRQIEVGSKATVTTDNGYTFTYTFEESEKVQPNDVAVLNYSGQPARLTLQTCPGVPNLTRQIFFFMFTSYTKN